MKKTKHLRKSKCKLCGGIKTERDFTDGGRSMVMWRMPRCLHKWEVIEEKDFNE